MITHASPEQANQPAGVPSVDEVVVAALLAACQDLHARCGESTQKMLRRVLCGKPLDQLGEHQLRKAYGLLRRAVTKTHTAAPGTQPAELEDITYTLELPWPRPPLSRNGSRGHPIARSKTVKAVRKAGWALAREQKIPQHDHIVVRLHYAPGRRQPQDPMNWTDTSKALIDGLRDAGVVVDDNTEHVTEWEPEILFPPEPGPRCWLTITVA